MNELPITEFKKAIRATHGADATLFNRFRVVEVFQDHPVWDGEVLVFNLSDHLTTKIWYAWSVDGRVTAVLHEGPVDSPRAAVRAAIVAEHRTQGGHQKMSEQMCSCDHEFSKHLVEVNPAVGYDPKDPGVGYGGRGAAQAPCEFCDCKNFSPKDVPVDPT